MKQEEVMERVYEPGRLHEAWQQVKKRWGSRDRQDDGGGI